MKPFFHSSIIVAALFILSNTSLAQQKPGEYAPPSFSETTYTLPPIELDADAKLQQLELMIHRWGESKSGNQTFSIELNQIPSFFSSATLSQNSISFNNDESEIPVLIKLEPKTIKEDSEDSLHILIKAEDTSITPAERTLIVPFKLKGKESSSPSKEEVTPGLRDFVIRTLKKEHKAKSMTSGIREKAQVLAIDTEEDYLYTIDPLYVCFTAPATEVKFQYFRILAPDNSVYHEGKSISSLNSVFGSNSIILMEGAPYEVIIPVKGPIKDNAGIEDIKWPRPPGIYAIEVSGANFQSSGLYGIPEDPESDGRWKRIGTFELHEPVFHFKGAVSLTIPDPNVTTNFYMKVSPIANQSANATFSFETEWVDKDSKAIMTHDVQVAANFPDQINYENLDKLQDATLNLSNPSSTNCYVWKPRTHGLAIASSAAEMYLYDDDPSSPSRIYAPSKTIFRAETTTPDDPTHTTSFNFLPTDFSHLRNAEINLEPDENNFGWYLRDPEMLFGISAGFETSLKVAIDSDGGASGEFVLIFLYGIKPGILSDQQLADLSRTMERRISGKQGADEDSKDGNRDGDKTSAKTPSKTDANNSGTTTDSASSSASTGDGNNTNENSDPNSIDPNGPTVSGHIQTWRRIAEPPQNATEGADLHYNEWGLKIGRTATGIAGAIDKPDEVGIRSSSEYLWSKRTTLDSVDHCTLEEYVMAKLQGNSIDHCKGRYKAPEKVSTPSLVGLTMDEAEATLVTQGLTPKWTAGPPAPDKSQVGKVVSQDPESGGKVQPGSTVTVEVYSENIPLVSVPNLSGKSVDQAEATLKTLGLIMSLEVGDPASNTTQQFTVQSQSPAARKSVEEGSSVTLTVYSEHIPNIKVPKISGLTIDNAEAKLKQLGLSMKLEAGDPAPSARVYGTVQSQQPAAGKTATPGDVVTSIVYSEYIPPATVANSAHSSGSHEQITSGSEVTGPAYVFSHILKGSTRKDKGALIEPTTFDASLKGGVFKIRMYNTARSSFGDYEYRWKFLDDISFLEPGNKYRLRMAAKRVAGTYEYNHNIARLLSSSHGSTLAEKSGIKGHGPSIDINATPRLNVVAYPVGENNTIEAFITVLHSTLRDQCFFIFQFDHSSHPYTYNKSKLCDYQVVYVYNSNKGNSGKTSQHNTQRQSSNNDGHLKDASVNGKYSELIQKLTCPKDKATYGNFNDWGYWGGGTWCGQQGKAGYWVWVSPTWYVWKNKIN
ncbi:MAG: PASTA domain-containing protein [Candidatus Brocadiaceae bacterium]|nr:PASTA domain-containing protein [Candidatus Brocadiaceae bacterium]